MITAPIRKTRAGPGARLRPWAAYMAASWALVFAAPHFHWGMGGTVGLTMSLNRQVLDHRTVGFLAGVSGWGQPQYGLEQGRKANGDHPC